MIKDMIVSSTALETKVAILEDDQLAELYIERHRNRGILANTYKGKVTKVLPGMQSAFVNIGLEKDAFLYVSDFVEDSEDSEQVFPTVDEPVEASMADAEVQQQERPQRRDRKGERNRWREKKERTETSRMIAAPEIVELPPEMHVEHWDIITETERLAETHHEIEGQYAVSEMPDFPLPISTEPVEISAETEIQPEPVVEPEIVELAPPIEVINPEPVEVPTEAPIQDSAEIRDDGEFMPFTSEDGSKPGFARRRGAPTRRKRYPAARHAHRPEPQSIDDILHEGQEVLVQVAKEPIGKKGARVTSHIALPGRYLVYMHPS
jgi:ribonuclease G